MLYFPGATFLKLKCSQNRLQLLSKQRYLDVGLTTSDSVGLLWNLMIVLSNKFSADCCWWWSWATLWKRLTWKKKRKSYVVGGIIKGGLAKVAVPTLQVSLEKLPCAYILFSKAPGYIIMKEDANVSWQGTVPSLGSGSKTFILTHVVETVPGYFPRKTV